MSRRKTPPRHRMAGDDVRSHPDEFRIGAPTPVDVLFLVGAGASRDSGIPDSDRMLATIQKHTRPGGKWRKHRCLFRSIRRTLGNGLREAKLSSSRMPGQSAAFNRRRYRRNIETFLDELDPAGGGGGMKRVAERKEFQDLVLEEIGCLLDPDGIPGYFKGFANLSRVLGRTLHVFSLNFDRGIEKNEGPDFHAETGFDLEGAIRMWIESRFFLRFLIASIYLYKMHGSIDWVETGAGEVIMVDPPYDIRKAALALGYRKKERGEFPSPYDTYARFFAALWRLVRQIVVLGYGFSDIHINRLLSMALRALGVEELLVVGRYEGEDGIERERREIAEILGVDVGKITVIDAGAKDFLGSIEKRLCRHPSGWVRISGECPPVPGETA